MHFATVAASAALVGSALAHYGNYESSAYYTTTQGAYGKATYTSVASCTEEKPGYTSVAPVYGKPTTTPAAYGTPSATVAPYVVTYTSHTYLTVTSCEAYVTNCPAKTYSSAVYSVSTCNEGKPTGYGKPTYTTPAAYTTPGGYYVPSSNCSESVYTPTTTPCETPVYSTKVPVYTTVYTTVCPGANYCYGTTITTTVCPETTPVPVVYSTTPVAVYTQPASYSTKTVCYGAGCGPATTVAPVCNGYNCPPHNATTPAPHAPQYTGAAGMNTVSFGVAAIAAVAALFVGA